MQESSVEKFGAVHAKVQKGDNKQETTHGESLRELQRFFEEHDKHKGYAGLRRIADKDGTAVWTLLKQETEVAVQLEKRAGERREEEQRHEKIFSDQARSRSEAADAVDTLRAELKASREKEAKARGEAETARKEVEMAREKEAKARKEAEVVPQVVATNDRQHQQITSQLSKIQDELSEMKRDEKILETLRAELQAAREKVATLEAKA